MGGWAGGRAPAGRPRRPDGRVPGGRWASLGVVRRAPIETGDIVEVDKKGRRFMALVIGVESGGDVRIEPVCRGVSWRSATSRELVRHWKKAARRRRQADPDEHEEQLDLGLDLDPEG